MTKRVVIARDRIPYHLATKGGVKEQRFALTVAQAPIM